MHDGRASRVSRYAQSFPDAGLGRGGLGRGGAANTRSHYHTVSARIACFPSLGTCPETQGQHKRSTGAMLPPRAPCPDSPA